MRRSGGDGGGAPGCWISVSGSAPPGSGAWQRGGSGGGGAGSTATALTLSARPPRVSTPPPPAAPPSWSRTPAAGSTSTSPRSSRWKPSTTGSRPRSRRAEVPIPVSTRIATAQGSEALARLMHAFNSEYEEETPPVEKLTGFYRELIEAGELTAVLAGDGPDGYCQFRLKRSHITGKPDAHVEELYVVPAHRGAGIGR